MNVWARDLSLYLGQLVAAWIVLAAIRTGRLIERRARRDYSTREGA